MFSLTFSLFNSASPESVTLLYETSTSSRLCRLRDFNSDTAPLSEILLDDNGPWDCPPHILKGDYRGALYAQRQLVFLRFDNGGCVGMVDLSSNAKQTRESVLARAEREGLNWLPQSHKEWNPFAYDSWSYWLEAQRDFERIIESIEL